MSPLVRRITAPIFSALDSSIRQAVLRRVDAMERELAYLALREDKYLRVIRRNGWTDERIQVLFALNSVYQQLLGPLQASARPGPEGLGSTVSVRHGSASFNRETATTIQLAMRDFHRLVHALSLSRVWLQSNTCSDIVFAIATADTDED